LVADPTKPPGHACQDTKDFVNATGLLGKQTYLLACKLQLKNTTIDFNSIDYGFQYEVVYTTKGWIMQVAAWVFIGLFALSFLFFLANAIVSGGGVPGVVAAFVWLGIGVMTVVLLWHYALKNVIL